MRCASSTATEEIETPFSLIAVSARAPLAGRQRAAEEAVEDRAGGALDQRQLVGALDLALDLGLAEDHRVEPRGDAEEVAGGLGGAQRVEVADQLGRPDLGLAGEDAERGALGLDRVRDDEVELGAVAGRERRRLLDLVGGAQLAQHADGAALGQRQPLAQLQRRGLVGDAEGEELRHRCRLLRSRSGARPGSSTVVALLREARELAQLALDPLQLRGHDRDVDQDQDDEDDVGAGDVLARLVEGQGRHQSGLVATPGAIRAALAAGSRSRARRSRESCARGVLGGQLELDQGRPEQRHRRQRDQEGEPHLARQAALGGGEGARVDEALGQPHREEVERDEGAGGDREDRGVAGLALAVLDRVAEGVVGRVEQEDDQEADQRRLVPDPPVPPGGLGPDRAGDQHAGAEDDRDVDRDVGAQSWRASPLRRCRIA